MACVAMSGRLAGLLLVGASLLVGGCATPPPPVRPPRTTVILMPDEDGQVGAVSVSGGGSSRWLDSAFSFATVEGRQSAPSAPQAMDREAVDAAHAQLLKAQPLKPKSFVLYFLLDKSVLTDESKAMIPALLEAVRERKPTEITIFGHADATGTEGRNFKLSADRARVVAELLRRNDPDLDHIDVHFFGDKVPLVETNSRAPEPRNRRAEVMIL